MDVIVNEMPGNSWGLTDLLGRDMGRVTEIPPGAFMIQPAGNAIETLAANHRALVCFSRRRPGRDRGAHSGRMSPRAVSDAGLLLVAAAAKRRSQAD